MNALTWARTSVAVALFAVFGITSAGAQNATPMRIRGTIESINGQDLVVKSRDGTSVAIKLAADYAVTGVIKADFSDVAIGKFVGIASLPQGNGPEKALEVLVFPESGRGSGEGHYAWDLQPGSMMTNATVAEATDGSDGRTVALKHKDGNTNVTVPKDVPVVTFAPGDRSLMVPGAGVMVPAAKQPDGTFTASRILVGKDGVVPPM